MAMRSATKSSRIMSTSDVPSTYSEWARDARPAGVPIRSAPELDDALRDAVGVLLLLGSVLLEFLLDRVRAQPLRHEVVALVAQHANDFRRQCVIQQLDDGLAIGAVARGHRPFLDMCAR